MAEDGSKATVSVLTAIIIFLLVVVVIIVVIGDFDEEEGAAKGWIIAFVVFAWVAIIWLGMLSVKNSKKLVSLSEKLEECQKKN